MKLRRKPKPPKDDETPQECPPATAPGVVRRENKRQFERAIPMQKETR